jgi:hypothetical protein
MISFWISVVPPKIAITGRVGRPSRLAEGLLPSQRRSGPVTRSLSRAALARSLAAKPVCSGGNGREAFQQPSRYYS